MKRTTIVVPADAGTRTREQLDAARFGTIGFDVYKAIVFAEIERAYQAGLRARHAGGAS